MPKNWHLRTVVLEKTPESPLDSKEIKPVLREISLEYSLEKPRMLGKIESRRRRGHQRMRWLELGQTLGDGDGQRGLACCSPWGHEESNVTGQLNKNSA